MMCSTLDVEGDVDKLSCAYRFKKHQTSLESRKAEGKDVRAEGHRPCERSIFSAAFSCMFGELHRLSGMTPWAYSVLLGLGKEVGDYRAKKVEEVRLHGWSSVGFAKQALGHIGAKGTNVHTRRHNTDTSQSVHTHTSRKQRHIPKHQMLSHTYHANPCLPI